MPRDAARVTPARYRAAVLASTDGPAGLACNAADALGARDCTIGGAILDQIRVAVAHDAADMVGASDRTVLIGAVLYAAQSAKPCYAADFVGTTYVSFHNTTYDGRSFLSITNNTAGIITCTGHSSGEAAVLDGAY